jgi:hypothetical protein
MPGVYIEKVDPIGGPNSMRHHHGWCQAGKF